MTKKMKRVLLSAFVCAGMAILGGAALQFDKAAVKAETSPKLNICGYTLSLKDNIHIKYAVSTENTATATDFGMLVWTEPQTEYVYGTQATVLEKTSTTEQNGVEYPVFEYAELAARQMTDVVYSRAYAVVDGEYYYSEVKKYSILEYAYNKLGLTEATATSDQALVDLLNGMLEYGGLAQTYFGYKTDELASDPFAYVRVANATFADGFDYGIFRTGKEVTVTPNDGYVLSENAPNAFKADENGNVTLTVPQEKEIDETAFEIPGAYSRGLAYTLNEDGASYSVTDIGDCADTDVIIPATYKTLPVTAIGVSAFSGYGITSITLPDSIISIEKYAFYSCINLTSVNIPNGVTSIGEYAFYDCRKLTSIMIPDSVNLIENNTFGASGLTNVTIGNRVTSIGDRAFQHCSALTNINIPDSVTTIGSSAFYNCSSLMSVTIGNSVMSIGILAFESCRSLSDITIGNSVTSIEAGAFSNCSGLTSITIPDSVTLIGAAAFKDCSSLMSITIGNSVTSIESAAFYKCSNLTDITIPDSVTSIGNYAFQNCSSLTSVTIPNSVTSIGSYAFYKCSSLTSVTIGNSVTSIGGYAFWGCSSLTSVTIPDSVTSIGYSAFSGCSGLTSVIIPDSVTTIGTYAFYSCSGLTSITIPDSVTSIGNYAFQNCSGLTNITIPDSVTSIGNSAFDGCSGLTNVKLGDSVTSIENYAFSGCSSLTSVTIGNSVTSIGIYAFQNCSSLTNITIPDSVTTIGYSAFEDCDSLTSITIPDGVTSIGDGVFSGCSDLTSITVGENNVAYQSIDGNLYTKDGLTLIQYAIGKTATKFTIPDSVTSIESSAFSGCSGLTSVYYEGTYEEWNKISISSYNTDLTDATRYYYSESEPALNADGTAYDGNYWHYNENGEITVWEYVEATFTVVVGSNTVTLPADGTATLQFTAPATLKYKITCSSGTLTDENGATVSIISCTKVEVYTVILTATAGSAVKVTIQAYDPDEENWTPNY